MSGRMFDEKMDAIVLRGEMASAALSIERCAKTRPKSDEVQIRVCAAGVNYVDIRQRQGLVAVPPDHHGILGLEVAGKIVAIGDNVRRWREGDRVCALLSGGGYASYVCAKADLCLPIPRGCDESTAAALPEALFTAWSALFDLGRLKPRETVLVYGGAGGIGTAAIQLAHLFGARVISTCGSREKCHACEKLGADRAINYREEDLSNEVYKATDGNGVDVILDIVGGAGLRSNVAMAAQRGRIISIGFMTGAVAELDLQALARKRATITGGFLRDLSPAAKADLARSVESQVWPWIEQGQYRPIIDSTFPMNEAFRAHQRMESGMHIGKIILINDERDR